MYPRTIEEFLQLCQSKGMPLYQMRFFIGEDCHEARCFGIYRDGDRVIVYKNKADGSRAIRYDGPDEAEACRILYEKMDEEILFRRYMKEEQNGGGKSPAPRPVPAKPRHRFKNIVTWTMVAVVIAGLAYNAIDKAFIHRNGYYHYNNGIYYRLDRHWYTWDDEFYRWHMVDALADELADAVFDSDYSGAGVLEGWEAFEDTAVYKSWEDDHGSSIFEVDWSSSDWSDWDLFDTDWSSDW